jgi:hypothetical protein
MARPTRPPMTANQLVAYNLRRARQEYEGGLTQKQAAELLEPYLGKRWSVASFSAAEASAKNGSRGREFSADEILAFARAFNVPISYFFLPPEEDQERRPVTCGGSRVLDVPELLESASRLEPGSAYATRLRLLTDKVPRDERFRLDRAIQDRVQARLGSPSVTDVTTHAANLRRLANALEAADDHVQAVFAEELDHAFGKEEQ